MLLPALAGAVTRVMALQGVQGPAAALDAQRTAGGPLERMRGSLEAGVAIAVRETLR
ncbi:hypothetical protein [Streptomyces cyaneofuscatus]|uniref:hypothetical protein n=1 Tax=Streptomyces cyaneofuscatus TaxID=66883 RepID=UPI0037A05EEC